MLTLIIPQIKYFQINSWYNQNKKCSRFLSKKNYFHFQVLYCCYNNKNVSMIWPKNCNNGKVYYYLLMHLSYYIYKQFYFVMKKFWNIILKNTLKPKSSLVLLIPKWWLSLSPVKLRTPAGPPFTWQTAVAFTDISVSGLNPMLTACVSKGFKQPVHGKISSTYRKII